MCWVYKYIEKGINGLDNQSTPQPALNHWVVGYYIGDDFQLISTFYTEDDAINRVSKLNGGQ